MTENISIKHYYHSHCPQGENNILRDKHIRILPVNINSLQKKQKRL